MHLSEPQVDRFYRLWFSLLAFVNKKHKVLPSFPRRPEVPGPPLEKAAELRAFLWEDPDLLERYLRRNPDKLGKDDLDTVRSWKYRIQGFFAIMEHRQDCSIFMDAACPALAYGVLGLTEPIQSVAGKPPRVVEAVLLPFEGRIIYDGFLIEIPNAPRDIKRMFKEVYRFHQSGDTVRMVIETPVTGAPDPRIDVALFHSRVILEGYQEVLQKQNPLFTADALAVLEGVAQNLAFEFEPPSDLSELAPQDLAEWAAGRSEVELDTVAAFVQHMAEVGLIEMIESQMLLLTIGRGALAGGALGQMFLDLGQKGNLPEIHFTQRALDMLAGAEVWEEQDIETDHMARQADSGGVPIPKSMYAELSQRIEKVAKKEFAGRYTRLDFRFKGKFFYIDAYTEPTVTPGWPPADWPETSDERVARLRETPTHLCRLRYFGEKNRWGFAFYKYSDEKYEVSVFPNGQFYGKPEDAFRAAAGAYLT